MTTRKSDRFWGTCVVVKRYKRLHLAILETDEIIYTPPNFVRLASRMPLRYLAKQLTDMQRRDIEAIAEFEGRHTRRASK